MITRASKTYEYLKDEELKDVIPSSPDVIIDSYAIVGDFIENCLSNAQ
jgi:hypothetical protein